jgi:hypothetical protein
MQGFAPSETIQTGQAMRYMNTVLGAAEYSFSRRSSFTAVGSYGILHFTNASYISSRNMNAQAGYDYLLDPRDSIAVLASYAKIDYTGSPISMEDYKAAFAFGRKINGRLALQLAGGPEWIRVTSTPNGNFQFLTWSVNSGLTYERRRSGVSASFMRGLTGGSGALFGATSYTLSGSAHHQFTRFWFGSVNGGYAFNVSVAPAGIATTSFKTWFTGANFGRQIGRHAGIGFNYGFVKQDNGVASPVSNLGATGFQQTFGVTVNWHLRPSE